MSPLTGPQIKILREGITQAYQVSELRRFLAEEMNVNFDIISQGNDYNTQVFNLIRYFDAQGKIIEEFIRKIVRYKPNSPYLKKIISEFKNILDKTSELDDNNSEQFTADMVKTGEVEMDINELLDILKELIPTQFNELLFRLRVPKKYLLSEYAPQAERAIKLLEWADSPTGIGLAAIQQKVERMLK